MIGDEPCNTWNDPEPSEEAMSPFARWAARSPLRRPDRLPVKPHAGPKGGLNRRDHDTLTAGARIAPCGREGR
jgi:hypothetical protein